MIVVTGTGIVSAIGTNTSEVARALLADTNGIAPVRFLETQHRQMPVGEVKLSNEDLAQRLGVPCTAQTSRTMLLGTLALREALAMAGIDSEQLADVALVSGTTVADMDCAERCFDAAQSCNSLGDCGRSTEEMVQHIGPFVGCQCLHPGGKLTAFGTLQTSGCWWNGMSFALPFQWVPIADDTRWRAMSPLRRHSRRIKSG